MFRAAFRHGKQPACRLNAASPLPGFERVRQLAAKRGGPAHLLVEHRGEIVVDHRIGVGPQAAFWPFSVSKIFIAALVWSLIADGTLDPHTPIAEHWPEFASASPAAEAKSAITVMDVLTHRSGLPRPGGPAREILALGDYARNIRQIEAASPIRPPSGRPAYEWLAWGYILGELACRATGTSGIRDAGRPIAELLRQRVLDPIGARDTFLGLPATERWRAVPMTARGPATLPVATVLNSARVRGAVIPAGGVSTTAHDALRLLRELCAVGERLGLRPEHVAQLTAPSNDGEYDPFAGSRTWWGHGVQLGHPAAHAVNASAFGRLTSERAWGHNGSNVATAWHDPDRDLSFVYFSGIIEMFPVNRMRFLQLQDAAVRAADSTN